MKITSVNIKDVEVAEINGDIGLHDFGTGPEIDLQLSSARLDMEPYGTTMNVATLLAGCIYHTERRNGKLEFSFGEHVDDVGEKHKYYAASCRVIVLDNSEFLDAEGEDLEHVLIEIYEWLRRFE